MSVEELERHASRFYTGLQMYSTSKSSEIQPEVLFYLHSVLRGVLRVLSCVLWACSGFGCELTHRYGTRHLILMPRKSGIYLLCDRISG